VQGQVILEATIDPKGDVRDLKVLRSIPLLDQAAIDAVRQWQFSPTLLNGVAVPVIMTVTVSFTLTEDATTINRDCSGGNLTACMRLAQMLRSGNGAAKDAVTARTLYERACDGGEAAACSHAARMMEHGEGVPVDLAAAARLARKGCDADSAAACTALARMTYTGRGAAKNAAQATALYERAIATSRRACERRDTTSCLDLAFVALIYQTGREGPHDQSRAIDLYRAACDNHAVAACAFLAAAFEAGAGAPKDASQAAPLYQQACPAVAPALPDDPDRATMALTARVQACGSLAALYERGDGGVPQSRPQAITLYQRACDAQQVKGVELPRLQNRCDDVTRLQARHD
jgi:TonB family protein